MKKIILDVQGIVISQAGLSHVLHWTVTCIISRDEKTEEINAGV
jgi:hypothetical protein